MKPARLLPPLLVPFLLAAVLLTGCSSSNGIESKEAVRQAMIEYLRANSTSTGLDPDIMDISVDAVVFERDVARATIAFRVKGGNAGMQMNYTLDRVGDKWVTRKPNSKGAPHPAIEPDKAAPPETPGGTAPQGGELPAGHPPIDGKSK